MPFPDNPFAGRSDRPAGGAGGSPSGGSGGGFVEDIPGGTVEYAAGSEGDLMARSRAIEEEERRRYDLGLGTATRAFEESRDALSSLLDSDLLFSRAADAVGARAKSSVEGLRRSLGARGMRPGSGASNAMAQRIASDQGGALIGAKRDIALANQQVKQKNAAIMFAQALGLSSMQQAPVSQVGLDTATNIFEGNIAREGIASAERSNARANSSNKQAAAGGGIASVASAAIAGK